MRVVIVGCGKVGYTIAGDLVAEKDVDVTIIDQRQDAFERASETIDVMPIKGNGLNLDILTDAGAREADLLISAMSTDESNILCCIAAKHLGAKHTIARVRNPEYALSLNALWQDLGLDMIINPEQETAREISRLLRFPAADEIDTFVSGRVEMVSFTLAETRDFFVGRSVAQIFYKKKVGILLVTVERDDKALIPHGDLVFEEHDIIRVVGRPSEIMSFFAMIGKNTEGVKNATIIGGSKITYYLVELLQRHSSQTNLTIIDMDRERCRSLSELFPRCTIINGNGTDEELLATADIDPEDAVLCLTNRDEENIVMALYHMQSGVRKVVVKADHINLNMVKDSGLGSIVSPKHITSDQVVRYVRRLNTTANDNIRTVYKIFDSGGDRVEAVELKIRGNSRCLETPLRLLRLKKGVLIGCLVRDSDIIIPSGESVIRAGDSVIIIAKNDNILELDDVLSD